MNSESEKIKRWYGCYGSGRGDLFVPASNVHPAKMAVALCYRIFEHGRQMGYWQPGDVILDPMAGIGTTLICGFSLGYSVLGVELEEHFVTLMGLNMLHCEEKVDSRGWFSIAQGDARRLTELLAGVDSIVTSPPYGEALQSVHGIDASKVKRPGGPGSQTRIPSNYNGVVASPPYGDQVPSEPIAAWVLNVVKEQGMAESVRRYRAEVMDRLPKHGRWSDENIQAHIEAAMRIREGGQYSGAITSPPYAACPGTPSLGSVNKDDWGKDGRDIVGRRGLGRGYSGVVTSPPYSETHVGNPGEQELVGKGQARLIGTSATGHGGKGRHGFQYSHDETAQIGNLRDPRSDIDAVVSSPPYGDRLSSESPGGIDWTKQKDGRVKPRPHSQGNVPNRYGKTDAQIGNLRDPKDDIEAIQKSQIANRKSPETYLSAMLAVYREMHAVLKPGGVVCLVTKNPVKAGAIRRLDADTIRLMEAAGFSLIERKMAMLSEDLGEQGRLDGGTDKICRERKNFFKRLFERKRPDLRVDHEDVMFFRKV